MGLARNAIYQFLREQPRPLVFLAAAQTVRPGAGVQLVIHSEMSLATVAAGVTSALREADPRIAVSFRVFDRQIDGTIVRERLLAMLSMFFAAVAALLALLGLYGVIAYGVTKRTNEIGVRMALGAGRGAVLTMILREAAVLITAGIAAGLVIALAAGKLAASLLYGITPHEPVTLATATAVLVAAGLLASYWPARAATRMSLRWRCALNDARAGPSFCFVGGEAHSPSASTSPRSLARPVARLFLMKASRPMTSAMTGPKAARVRVDQASLNVRPESSVSTSIRSGGKPIWKTMPGRLKSSALTCAVGAPNCSSADMTLAAFSGVASTHTSRSPSPAASRARPVRRRRR